jgi:hypothetical protein
MKLRILQKKRPRTESPHQKTTARLAAEAGDTIDVVVAAGSSAPQEAMAVDMGPVGLAPALRASREWAAMVWEEVAEDAGVATMDHVPMEDTRYSTLHSSDRVDLMNVDLLTTVAVVAHLACPLVPLISGK